MDLITIYLLWKTGEQAMLSACSAGQHKKYLKKNIPRRQEMFDTDSPHLYSETTDMQT